LSAGRDWKAFNDEWRYPHGKEALRKVVSAVSRPILAAEPIAKRLEPLGIFLAVIGLTVSVVSFLLEYQDRDTERQLRAWDAITTKGAFNGAKLVAFEFLTADGKNLSGAELANVVLEEEDLSGFDLQDTDLSGAIISSANLQGADFGRATLNDADFSLSDLRDAYLTRANLQDANLTGADLQGATLSNTDLQRVIAFGADLRNVILIDTKVGGAELNHSDLSGTSMARVKGIDQDQLSDACGDETTQSSLSDGLTIPLCSEVPWWDDFHGDPSS
jgi:uncharacterized protein YjbI with pentapeptide repeats